MINASGYIAGSQCKTSKYISWCQIAFIEMHFITNVGSGWTAPKCGSTACIDIEGCHVVRGETSVFSRVKIITVLFHWTVKSSALTEKITLFGKVKHWIQWISGDWTSTLHFYAVLFRWNKPWGNCLAIIFFLLISLGLSVIRHYLNGVSLELYQRRYVVSPVRTSRATWDNTIKIKTRTVRTVW